jgi:hypothetical protein
MVWIDRVLLAGVPDRECRGERNAERNRRRFKPHPKLSTRLSVTNVPTTLMSTTASQ